MTLFWTTKANSRALYHSFPKEIDDSIQIPEIAGISFRIAFSQIYHPRCSFLSLEDYLKPWMLKLKQEQKEVQRRL